MRISEINKQYYFVYTLSHNGHIFYVGCSKNLVKRYTFHINRKTNNALTRHMQSIIESGQLPLLNIITYKPRIEALSIEETLIKCMSIGGQNILNTQSCHFVHKVNHTQKNIAYKSIEAEQEIFITKAKNWGGYYSPSIRK